MISLAISPCPNDTFIFEELALGRTSLGPVSATFLDIAELNALARSSEGPDLLKVSCASVPLFLEDYRLLPCGGAMGEGCGPLLLGLPGSPDPTTVAIPGHGTTAHVLFRFYLKTHPARVTERMLRFDRITSAILAHQVSHGVIIHETRFVYREMGLEATADLGAHWERETGSPIPLGALLVRRDRGEDFARKAIAAVRQSLAVARKRKNPVSPWIADHAREMNLDVQRSHIATYVTPYSHDIGPRGLRAMEVLWETAGTILRETSWPGPDALGSALQETASLSR